MNKKLNELLEVLLEMKSKEKMEDFLRGILTPTEIEEVSQRLQIIKMLKDGVRQQVIAERLGVGIATVTRGARELKFGRFKYV